MMMMLRLESWEYQIPPVIIQRSTYVHNSAVASNIYLKLVPIATVYSNPKQNKNRLQKQDETEPKIKPPLVKAHENQAKPRGRMTRLVYRSSLHIQITHLYIYTSKYSIYFQPKQQQKNKNRTGNLTLTHKNIYVIKCPSQ